MTASSLHDSTEDLLSEAYRLAKHLRDEGEAEIDVDAASLRSGGRKARVTLDGSVEQLQERLRSACIDWAAAAFPRDLFIAGLEATWPDESKAVIYVETWDQPWGGGDYHQANYEIDDDGVVSLGEPVEVELIGVVSPKSLPDAAAAKKSSVEAPARSADPLADPEWVRAQVDLVELDL